MRALECQKLLPSANTDIRNHLEHYDERLERWWQESTDHNHIDRIVGPSTMIDADFHELDWFRHFDPQSGTLIFWGEQYDLEALVRAAKELLSTAEREAAKPHWEDPNTRGGY